MKILYTDMNSNKNKDLAMEYFVAMGEKDIPKILSLYDSEAEHTSPEIETEIGTAIRGKQNLVFLYEKMFLDNPEISFRLQSVDECRPGVVCLKYIQITSPGKDAEELSQELIVNEKTGLITKSKIFPNKSNHATHDNLLEKAHS